MNGKSTVHIIAGIGAFLIIVALCVALLVASQADRWRALSPVAPEREPPMAQIGPVEIDGEYVLIYVPPDG